MRTTKQLTNVHSKLISLWGIRWVVRELRALPIDLLELWVMSEGRWRTISIGTVNLALNPDCPLLLVRPMAVNRCPSFGAALHMIETMQRRVTNVGPTGEVLELRLVEEDPAYEARVVFWHSVRRPWHSKDLR